MQCVHALYVRVERKHIAEHRDNLPVEFKLTGIRPEPWTPETVVLRANQRVLGDAASELRLARSVAQLGAREANRRAEPDPWEDLKVPEGLNVNIIGEDVLHTAPRLALAILQAVRRQPVASIDHLDIPMWNDGAIRQAVNERTGRSTGTTDRDRR